MDQANLDLEAEAAVYGQELAGDEGGGSSEEEGRGGHVFGGSVALHGGLVGEVLVGFADLTLDDHAGGDAVDADVGGPGFGHCLREHVQGRLGGAVVTVGRPGVHTAE